MSLDGFAYDLARARRETYAHPGALPDVSPAPLSEDLLRRDFTVNALAIALVGDRPGPSTPRRGALEDLGAAQAAGAARRAASSTIRPALLRLARYAARLEFEIEPHTRALLRVGVGRRARLRRSAARESVPSCGCSRESPIP